MDFQVSEVSAAVRVHSRALSMHQDYPWFSQFSFSRAEIGFRLIYCQMNKWFHIHWLTDWWLTDWLVDWWQCLSYSNSDHQRSPETRLSRGGGELNNRKWVLICFGGWLLTVDCIVYSDIFNTFNSPYCRNTRMPTLHCVTMGCFLGTREWKIPKHEQRKFDLNLSGK